jgi:hypothetical protein
MERFETKNPITYAELCDCFSYYHGVVISAGTLRYQISAIDLAKTTKGITMEGERVAVSSALLTE